ncbi:unnamed protein product [Oncorhynchus mykiss]|uniref:ST3 beta-galactoside alpha-2,3-sialyltransferase 1 n=1 Tax=Oncorhynchus mykiss TaxID=8022 RepID=A0A060XV10_ONCMY|nr:unnamed protein product [Oncorhynchus mykiss]
MDAGPERCRTCAVVGNSGNLKGSHYGALIDSNDVIIRMNMAPTFSYEEDVGSRTTHQVMYPESAIDLDNTTRFLLIPFKTLDLQWLPGAITNGSNITYASCHLLSDNIKSDSVLVLNPAFMKYVHQVWLDYQGKYPSTGFMALILAIHICDEVRLLIHIQIHALLGMWIGVVEVARCWPYRAAPGRRQSSIPSMDLLSVFLLGWASIQAS